MTKFTIQYRYLKQEGLADDLVLKDAILEFLRRDVRGQQVGSSAKLRIVDLDQDGSVVILNRITASEHWDQSVFGGQLIQLQPGQNVPAVLQSLEDDATEFLLEQIDLGNDAQVVKGVLYFAVAQNHVGLMEGQAVKGRTLERYLTSILQTADVIAPGEAVILNGEFLAADGKQLDAATTLTVAAVPNLQGARTDANETIATQIDRQAREGATVLDVLRTLGWTEEAVARLEQEVPDGGWLEGLFSFAIKERRRKKPISRATVNEALRNIDPADLGMDGEGREKGGIVKLSMQRSVKMIGSLKEPEDAIEQIVHALREWAQKGTIRCTFD